MKNACLVYTPNVFVSHQQRLRNSSELTKVFACDDDVTQLAEKFIGVFADPVIDVELKKKTLATFAAEIYARGFKAGSEARVKAAQSLEKL